MNISCCRNVNAALIYLSLNFSPLLFRSHSLALSFSLARSRALSHSHFLSRSFSLSFSLSKFISFTQVVSCPVQPYSAEWWPKAPTISLSLFLSLSLSLALFCSLSLSLSLSLFLYLYFSRPNGITINTHIYGKNNKRAFKQTHTFLLAVPVHYLLSCPCSTKDS